MPPEVVKVLNRCGHIVHYFHRKALTLVTLFTGNRQLSHYHADFGTVTVGPGQFLRGPAEPGRTRMRSSDRIEGHQYVSMCSTTSSVPLVWLT